MSINIINLDSTSDKLQNWVYNLTVADEQILLSAGWLTDSIINDGKNLIMKHFLRCMGFKMFFWDIHCLIWICVTMATTIR